MVFRTTGVGLLALMMRAERTQAGLEPDTQWLLHGPVETDAVESDDAPPLLLAGE
jgi:hypothetical protein